MDEDILNRIIWESPIDECDECLCTAQLHNDAFDEIERLRIAVSRLESDVAMYRAELFAAEKAYDKQRNLLDRLSVYIEHDQNCAVQFSRLIGCSCGLDEVRRG